MSAAVRRASGAPAWRSAAACLAAGLLLGGCGDGEGPAKWLGTPSPSASGGGAPAAGAAGIGDPYFPGYGNGGYDALSYAVTARFQPTNDTLTATTTMRARATSALLSFHLDLAGLVVDKVTVDGRPARAARTDDELVVTPAAPLAAGAEFTVATTYRGRPRQKENQALGSGGWLHTADGAVAMGQPESASTWFPVNDHPSDKATYRFALTVPAGLVALANGVPAPEVTAGGWTTWTWAEDTPMASYLATAVIGRYRVARGTHKGRPVVTAVAASLPAEGVASRAMARTTRIADYLETVLGPYPVSAYGGVVVADDRIRYALETQSRPVYGPTFFGATEPAEDVVAHELAHQWCGDSVSLARWEDIWLNEGCATYAEWLWSQERGVRTAAAEFADRYRRAPATLWSLPPGRPGAERLFDESVYQRGAMTLHALRVTVGDAAFFRLLREWTAAKKDGNATTADFVALAERTAGRSLRPLFDAWLYGTTRPPSPTAG
ncbi:peptidase [Pilimelia terevasa]|uniref:Aminopeptidase N n=1 Tax=Pilimelia terevasa TaxID=53372 RepID=A0A8J3FFT5_9ACTN|nr:M1 family metallopeptidase [Pilimelia terevasa]GGK14176.1 peptidase [Pilimelia terevasa]